MNIYKHKKHPGLWLLYQSRRGTISAHSYYKPSCACGIDGKELNQSSWKLEDFYVAGVR